MRMLIGLVLMLIATGASAQTWDLRGDGKLIDVPNCREIVLYHNEACYADTFEPVFKKEVVVAKKHTIIFCDDPKPEPVYLPFKMTSHDVTMELSRMFANAPRGEPLAEFVDVVKPVVAAVKRAPALIRATLVTESAGLPRATLLDDAKTPVVVSVHVIEKAPPVTKTVAKPASPEPTPMQIAIMKRDHLTIPPTIYGAHDVLPASASSLAPVQPCVIGH